MASVFSGSKHKSRQWTSMALMSRAGQTLRVSQWSGSKFVSVTLLGLLGAALYVLSNSYTFFIYDPDISGNSLVTRAEIYAVSEVLEKSVFWVSPRDIAVKLQAHPYVQQAHVSCRLPHSFTVQLTERIPLLVWTSLAGEKWVDTDGRVLPPLEGARPTITLMDDEGLASTAEGHLDGDLARGIALISSLMPSVTQFRYDGAWGLLFRSPHGWHVALGDAERITEKVEALAGAQEDLVNRGEQPQLLDLRFPEIVYSR